MSLVNWNEKYTVGIAEFDEQHKKLMELYNKLYDAMKEGRGKDVLQGILNDLINYAKYHFESEEKCFAKFNYPGKSEHLKEHDDFRKSVMDLKKKADAGNPVITTELMHFLKDWLLNHIQGTDKKYGPYLNERGLK